MEKYMMETGGAGVCGVKQSEPALFIFNVQCCLLVVKLTT